MGQAFHRVGQFRLEEENQSARQLSLDSGEPRNHLFLKRWGCLRRERVSASQAKPESLLAGGEFESPLSASCQHNRLTI
jgi:hypothetical protein